MVLQSAAWIGEPFRSRGWQQWAAGWSLAREAAWSRVVGCDSHPQEQVATYWRWPMCLVVVVQAGAGVVFMPRTFAPRCTLFNGTMVTLVRAGNGTFGPVAAAAARMR